MKNINDYSIGVVENLHLRMDGILATVGWYSGSMNDALRHWLQGNGYEWQYDHFNRLWFRHIGLPRMRAAFAVVGLDPVDHSKILRIYKLVPECI